ncbi:TPA: WxL domain-containing protein [Enterococcus faecium]|nr:WxL domain-containing protein [Enterococcus faecium]
MKKIILATLLISTTILAGTVAVHADDLSGKSTAKIGLTKQDPDNPVGPIDPIDPDDNPPSNDPTGNTGDLRIDYISNIDFGTQTISGKTETYIAEKPASLTESQVSDLRGTGAGWHLQVNYDTEKPGFTSEDKTLSGAELTLPSGTAKSVADNKATPPATSEVVVNDAAQNIMTAAANTGLGTWADEMDTANVSLKVPSGNLVGDYTATLVWTLSDAPA